MEIQGVITLRILYGFIVCRSNENNSIKNAIVAWLNHKRDNTELKDYTWVFFILEVVGMIFQVLFYVHEICQETTMSFIKLNFVTTNVFIFNLKSQFMFTWLTSICQVIMVSILGGTIQHQKLIVINTFVITTSSHLCCF